MPRDGSLLREEDYWPGLHEAIVDERVWDQVHELMERQNRQTRHRWTQPYLLKAKLRTGDDFAMSPGSVHRPGKAKDKKRLVHYSVSQKAIRHGYRDCAVKSLWEGRNRPVGVEAQRSRVCLRRILRVDQERPW